MSESSLLSPALVSGSGRVLGARRGKAVLRAAVAAAAAATAVVVGSSSVWAAAPVFPTVDNMPVANESATVTLLAVGEGQTKVGPPVRAVDADGDSLTYSLSDGDPLHASFFTIDSSSGQISLKSGTRSGVYRVKVSASDDSDTATVDVVIHVTSPGHYPWEDSWVQARSVTAAGVTTRDQFGWAIDADSEVIVVGAYGSAPSSNGAVYVFDVDSGRQLAKLTSPNPAANGIFGNPVAVGGDTIFVGANQENSFRGRAYVFTKPVGGWADSNTATATLVPAAAHNGVFFSSHLAASDDGATVAVGMTGRNAVSGQSNSGVVFVFSKPTGGWANADSDDAGVVTLHAGTRISAQAYLGGVLAVSGDGSTIAVGAIREDSGGVLDSGAVYMFTKPDTGWAATTTSNVIARLSVESPIRRQQLGTFGLALSDDGSTLVAAAPVPWRKGQSDDSQIPPDAHGSAFVFVRPSDGWGDATETAELAAGFGHKYDYFGRGAAVSGSGDKIAVGNAESRSSNYRGSVYVYTKPDRGWAGGVGGDNLRVLTLADADSEPRHRYSFGQNGIAFIGENQLVAGQVGYVYALARKDELTAVPAGGLYGDNTDQSDSATLLPGSAHLFKLRQAQQQQQPVAPPPPPPPPPPPDDGTDGPDDGPEDDTDGPDEPEGPAPPPEFADVDEDSVHAGSIERAAALGITAGTTATTFSPSDTVTRAQMATFVARTWQAAGRDCPTSGAMTFDDVAARSTHAAGIACTSALGITAGTADRTFSPSEPVTRAQMATFLARAWQAAGRECPGAAASAFFDDVPADSTHAAGIACMASLRIARGTASGTFSPSDTVTRAQMATFLTRFHQALTT